MRVLAFGLFFLFLSSMAFAQEPEPFDFKGMVLGSDASNVEGTSRFFCGDPKSSIADRSCSLRYDVKETIAGAPVQGLSLYYYSGKLETIRITLDQRNFSQVAAALAEKYGEGAVRAETVHNRMGAAFENTIYSWRRGTATLEARRYSGKLDTSLVTYRTDFAVAEFERRRGPAAKEKAKDL